MNIKRRYKIPVGNLSKGEAEKLIQKLIDEYSSNDTIYLREIMRKDLIKTRLNKLNKIYEQDTN